MNERAKELIEMLQGEGFELSPCDIVDINSLCDDVDRSCEDNVTSPLVAWAGDTPFYQSTIQAALWFKNYACFWWEKDSLFAALAWCSAHSSDAWFFEKWEDEKKTRKEIERWLKGLNCTEAELIFAVGYVNKSGEDNEFCSESENELINDCPYTKIIHEMIAAELGLTVAEIKTMTYQSCTDILTRWARNKCAFNGGDTDSIKNRLARTSNIALMRKIQEIRGRENGS